jgi:hypothetical protein
MFKINKKMSYILGVCISVVGLGVIFAGFGFVNTSQADAMG